VCQPGYGLNLTTCSLCPKGTFQPGGNTGCQLCPDSTFYSPVDGAPTSAYTSTGVTLYTGSYSADACVPAQSQLSPEAGQAFFSPTAAIQGVVANATMANLTACMATCPAGTFCMTQFDSTTSSCKTANLSLANSTDATDQLVYKLPPATLSSASSVKDSAVKAKMISSGYYAHGTLPANGTAARTAWNSVGSALGADARTFVTSAAWDLGSSKADCKKKCDNSNVCFGFIFTSSPLGCQYRGGVDALTTRSFFVIPASIADFSSYRW
jgi:hypothetical protein